MPLSGTLLFLHLKASEQARGKMPHGLGKHIAQRRRADVRTNGVKHCPPFAPSPERSGVDARLDQRYNRLRREKQQEIEALFS